MSAGVAVVTGASRNLGRATAHALAKLDFHVIVNARSDLEGADTVVDEIRATGGSAEPVMADVTDRDAIAELFERAAAAGELRALINNASLRSHRAVDEIDDAQWRAVMSTSLDGSWHCIQAALPLLRRAGGGAIVNVLGGNALAGDGSRVHVSAAKHGLLGLTLGLADALRNEQITVNGVSPTKMTIDGVTTEAARLRVADSIAWLASPQAWSVTGQIVHIRGVG